MYLSSTVIQHGIIILQKEILRLEEIHQKCGDNWPDDFDPNDRWILELVLKDLIKNKTNGYEELYPNSKSFRFFAALIPQYIEENETSVPDEARLELLNIFNQVVFLSKSNRARNS